MSDPISNVESSKESNKKEATNTIMYLGVGTAKPNQENALYQANSNHAILVFAQAYDYDSANNLAIEHLQSTGWEEVVIDKLNPIDVKALDNAPSDVKSAYQKALLDNSHAMVLEAPKSSD